MWSRNGLRFFSPHWFTQNWPKCQLDGELWIKRNEFQRTVSVVKKHSPIDDEWLEITYMVYDAPGLNKTFRQRIQILAEELPLIQNTHIKLVEHIECQGQQHLEDELGKILGKEGEGVMLRDPNSLYEGRRSKTLLKVKIFTDEEADVIGHQPGTGRCAGMMGALLCHSHRGNFKIGSGFNDSQR